MRTRQNVHRQDLESSEEILASTFESPTISVPILSVAPSPEPTEPRRSNTRQLAYRLYEERGRVDGRDLEDGLRLKQFFSKKAGLLPNPSERNDPAQSPIYEMSRIKVPCCVQNAMW